MKNSGILLVAKEPSFTSFDLVALLRKKTHIQKIGHAGTLDPFATGVMVMLVGSEYTKKSDLFLHHDKQYKATLHLGIATDTYDCEGKTTFTSSYTPSLTEIESALLQFSGEIEQIPPMFSAKKIQGKKLYELARKGIEIPRPPAKVRIQIQEFCYRYPYLDVLVDCSKGTYIRSLAHDIGVKLTSYAHLSALTRTKSGPFALEECIPQSYLMNEQPEITSFLRGIPW